jgi:hypothetical protein
MLRLWHRPNRAAIANTGWFRARCGQVKPAARSAGHRFIASIRNLSGTRRLNMLPVGTQRKAEIGLIIRSAAAQLYRLVETIYQGVIVKWFSQKADRSAIEGAFANTLFGYRRNEYERDAGSLLAQMKL